MSPLALLPFLLAVPAAASEPAVSPVWTAREAVTSLRFNAELLADLGLELRAVEATGGVTPSPEGEWLSFATAPPFSLGFRAPHGGIEDFVAGSLRHRGGFELAWRGGAASLAGFELRPGGEPRTFEIRGARGEPVFLADHMHFHVDAAGGGLAVENMDLRLAPAFARRIGAPRHAGTAIGMLRFTSVLDVPPAARAAAGGCSDPDWFAEVDAALTEISSVGQTVRDAVQGLVAVTPSATLENVGTADVPWYEKFSGAFPPHGNDQHPFLVWAMYRAGGGRIVQIGQSEVKHAFFSINSGCPPCLGGHILWAGTGAPGHPATGCGDTYGQGTNADRGNLSLRGEIHASTGVWERCGSLWDPDCDDAPDTPPVQGSFDRRMAVAESDLEVSPAEYYVEAWYLVRGDVDVFNSMGHRRTAPSFAGSTWSFPLTTAFTAGPAVDVWVAPGTLEEDESNQVLDTGEGHLQLLARATPLGGGQWHYEYALMNHDFDRRVDSFTVPAAGSITGVGFRDRDDDGGNDWTVSTGSGEVTWTSPASENDLPWGTLFNFWFDAGAPPGLVEATLGAGEAGSPAEFEVSGVGPGGVTLEIFSDGFESGDATAWSAAVP